MDLSDKERREVEYKLDECSASELSKWEEDFITNVTDQVNRYNRISEKQLEILERIYEVLK